MFEFVPIQEKDLPFLIEVRNECRDFLHDNRTFTLADCQAWFRETKPDFHLVLYDGVAIGYLRISRHDMKSASIYVGMDLHHQFRGRGLAQQAYAAFWPILKERYQVSTAKLEVLSHNVAAQRLYQKLGFSETARLPRYAERDGRSVDSIIMSKPL